MCITLNSFYCGESLNQSEYLSLCSYLHHGFKVKLYTYNARIRVPVGVELADANEILNNDQMFLDKADTLDTFSNYFKYHFLYFYGGVFVSLEFICIKRFSLSNEKMFVSLISSKNGRRHVSSCLISVNPFDRTIKACLKAMLPYCSTYYSSLVWEKDVLASCIIDTGQLESVVPFESFVTPVPTNLKTIKKSLANCFTGTIVQAAPVLPAAQKRRKHDLTFVLIVNGEFGINPENIDVIVRIIRRVTLSPILIFEINPVQTYHLSFNTKNIRYKFMPDFYETQSIAFLINETIRSAPSRKLCIWRSNIVLSEHSLLSSMKSIEIQNCALCIPYSRRRYVDDIVLYFFKKDLNFNLLRKLLAARHNISKNHQIGIYLLDKEKYCSIGGENVNLYGSIYEDCERIERVKLSGSSIYTSPGWGYLINKKPARLKNSEILFQYYASQNGKTNNKGF